MTFLTAFTLLTVSIACVFLLANTILLIHRVEKLEKRAGVYDEHGNKVF